MVRIQFLDRHKRVLTTYSHLSGSAQRIAKIGRRCTIVKVDVKD